MSDDTTLPAGLLLSAEGSLLPGIAMSPAAAVTVPIEEASLVARARTGEQEAFGVLVRLHQRQVYLLAVRMLRDSEQASEVVQEVFLSAWQGLRGFRGDAQFATWLHRITYNYCLKRIELQRRDAQIRAELKLELARDMTATGTMSRHHAQNAERAMRETVRSEIENLPAKYRIVLIMRHMQELSYEEMAEVMRVPIGTVKTQLFRARALLKDRLEDLGRVRDQGMSRANELAAGIEAGLREVLGRGRDVVDGGDIS